MSLYNSTVVLLTLWTGYQHTANEVADVHSEETNLDTIQSQVYSLHQYLAADNESTSLYSVWSYLNDRSPPMNDSLIAIATQVSYSCLCQGRYAVFDHPRSVVVYNFGRVSRSVCMSVRR